MNTKEEKNILDHREFSIKSEKNEYTLRIEIEQENIHFKLYLVNSPLENIYKNNLNLLTIIDKLELNSTKYSNLDLILKIFDSLYEKNKISVNIEDDNFCTLLLKVINMFDEEVVKEIKLYKIYMNSDDKFNILYNKLKLLNKGSNINNNISNIEENNQIEIMENKIKELNKKDIIINEMKEKLINIENEIKKISGENINEIVSKKIEELEKKFNEEKIIDDLINKKLEQIEKKIISEINSKIDNINKDIIKDKEKKNNFIQNINENNKENKILKILEEKHNELLENIELTKKMEKEVEKIKKENNTKKEEINNINNKLANNFDDKKSHKEIESIKEEIKKINNKIKVIDKELKKVDNFIKEKDTLMSKIMEKQNNQKISAKINNKEIINSKFKDLNNNINDKYKELNLKINHNEYMNKINYEFKKEPQNLKYKLDITDSNTSAGWNDMFEIFVSYKDNKEYLISPNINIYNLDIYDLLDNKKISSLRGHQNNVRTIRYFINKKNVNFNEYLISADDDKIVIIWDITNSYNIKYKIETKYDHNIYSCLLIFPHNLNDNYIITSTYNESEKMDNSATKLYSLNDEKFIKYIKETNNKAIYYLLSWYNKKNNKYYIIQFTFKKIIINNLIEDEIYSELIQEPEDNHFSGFLFNKHNNDYLCTSSSIGYINIWDLYNKNIFRIINTNNCKLAHIIHWNNKFVLVADYNNKSFKIIDLEENKVVSEINGQHTDRIVCIKKIYHPVYGESLLSTGRDKTIKLWTI